MKTSAFVLSGLATLLVFSGAAQAQLVPMVTGTTCEVIRGQAVMTGSKVRLKPGTVGTTAVSCLLDRYHLANASGLNLFVTYRDSTGTAPGASVIANLVSVDRLTGARTTLQMFNSNTHPETVVAARGGSAAVPAPISTTDTFYSLEVELKRTTASQTVEFYGALFSTP